MITSTIVSILRSTGERPQQKELGEGVVWDNRKLRKLSNVSITCRGYILKKNLSATDDFSVPHLAFTDKFKIAAKKGLYLSINVFSMKELLSLPFLRLLLETAPAILLGQPNHAKV